MLQIQLYYHCVDEGGVGYLLKAEYNSTRPPQRPARSQSTVVPVSSERVQGGASRSQAAPHRRRGGRGGGGG